MDCMARLPARLCSATFPIVINGSEIGAPRSRLATLDQERETLAGSSCSGSSHCFGGRLDGLEISLPRSSLHVQLEHNFLTDEVIRFAGIFDVEVEAVQNKVRIDGN